MLLLKNIEGSLKNEISGDGVQLYTPVHLQPYYKKRVPKGDFPNAEEYATNAMRLPLYPGLQEDEQKQVVEKLAGLLAIGKTP